MRQLKFIFVGKSKTDFFSSAERYYLQQIKHFLPTEIFIVKDSRQCDITRRKKEETDAITAKTQKTDFTVCLDERGKTCTSTELSTFLNNWLEIPGKNPCFVLGGAYGLDTHFVQQADFTLSLSKMTFPHELARVVFLEQIYRAFTILQGKKYHH